MFKNIILMIILFACFDAIAEVNIVVPLTTAHIKHGDNDKDYNESNLGIGAEYVHDNKHVLGALYLKTDSHDNENYYFYYGRKYQISENLSAAVSILYPTNYDNLDVAPMLSVEYGYIRIMTTYPFGQLAGAIVDIVNVQLVIPLEF